MQFQLLSVFLLSALLHGCAAGQIEYVPLERVTVLPDKLNESSGMAHAHEGSVYLHNDSGNKNALYEVSLTTGEILHTIHMENAKNKDWEELAEDDECIYIGDFGNNSGKRDDLRILKVSRDALASGEEVEVEKIHFTYPGYKPGEEGGKHDFDCEAMIAEGDALYLFSKNRESLTTDVYQLPNKPGEYVAEKIANFNTQGLITAAAVSPGAHPTLALLGYRIQEGRYVSFLWIVKDFNVRTPFRNTPERLEVAPNLQAEAVIWDSPTSVLITNEEERAGRGQVSRIDLSAWVR